MPRSMSSHATTTVAGEVRKGKETSRKAAAEGRGKSRRGGRSLRARPKCEVNKHNKGAVFPRVS